MQIFVQTKAGKCTAVMVQPSDTIEHIKTKVKEEVGLPPDEQFILSLNGKLLEDGCTASSYNMQSGSTLLGGSGKAYGIAMLHRCKIPGILYSVSKRARLHKESLPLILLAPNIRGGIIPGAKMGSFCIASMLPFPLLSHTTPHLYIQAIVPINT